MIVAMEKSFTKVRSIKDIIISAILVVSGVLLLVFPTGAGINIAGFFMIFTGVLLALLLRTEYHDTETGEKYLKKEHYFQQEMNPLIVSALESRPESIDLSQANKGSTVKLDIYYSRTTGKSYLQLFEYIPYRYDPCSRIYEYELSKVEHLIK